MPDKRSQRLKQFISFQRWINIKEMGFIDFDIPIVPNGPSAESSAHHLWHFGLHQVPQIACLPPSACQILSSQPQEV